MHKGRVTLKIIISLYAIISVAMMKRTSKAKLKADLFPIVHPVLPDYALKVLISRHE